jgi:hypothetical protein
MYTGIKVTSKRVQDKIPTWLQNLLWYMVETMDVEEKDATQIFELNGVVNNEMLQQSIIHTQQNPCYRKEQMFSIQQAVTAKVIVIDNVSHCFMLIL